MDALLLARIQFGFTISFHIIFPALPIGFFHVVANRPGLVRRGIHILLPEENA